MHPAFSHMHTQIQYPCWAGEGGDVEESQGWLIDLGMVLIVSMMEGTTPVRVCTRACVSPALLIMCQGRRLMLRVFKCSGQTAAKVTP